MSFGAQPPEWGPPGGGRQGGDQPGWGQQGGQPPGWGQQGGQPPGWGQQGGQPPGWGQQGGQPPGWGHQQPGYGPPGGGPPPQNYLVWSILATIFCCLPVGIAAIVFGSQVSSKWSAGDYAGAERASQNARNALIASVVLGVVVLLIYFVALMPSSETGY